VIYCRKCGDDHHPGRECDPAAVSAVAKWPEGMLELMASRLDSDLADPRLEAKPPLAPQKRNLH
jgi:hypothetical protein